MHTAHWGFWGLCAIQIYVWLLTYLLNPLFTIPIVGYVLATPHFLFALGHIDLIIVTLARAPVRSLYLFYATVCIDYIVL